MKRILLAILTVACVIFCLVACGDGTDSGEHTHSYGEWSESKAPTCTEPGERVQKCSCGSTKTEKINATGHDYKSELCSNCEQELPESTGLEFTLNRDYTYSVNGIGTCESSHIRIPSTYMGRAVTGINEGAFENCTIIVVVIIPESVTSIGDNAFKGCTELNTVSLPESVKSIGNSAFEGCIKLVVVIMVEGLDSIGERAFAGCTSLGSFYLPSSLGYLGTDAFLGCIRAIINTVLDSLPDGWEIKDVQVYYGHSHVYESWNTVKEPTCAQLGKKEQFCACGYKGYGTIETVAHTEKIIPAVPPTCTELGSTQGIVCSVCGELIKSCETIPYDHTYVDGYCSKCGAEASTYGVTYSLLKDGTYEVTGLFDCKDTVIYIPSKKDGINVTSIASNAFKGYSDITRIILPETITAIGSYAFSGCTSLEEINIPSNVDKIQNYCFEGCKSLKSIDLPKYLYNIYSYAFCGCESLKSVVLPEGLRAVSEFAFSQCYSLGSVDIKGRTQLGRCAFSDCYSLASVKIAYGVTFGINAFISCDNLVEVYNLSTESIVAGQDTNGRVAFNALVVHKSLDEASIIDVVNGFVFAVYGEKVYLLDYTGEEKNITLPSDYKGKAYVLNKSAFAYDKKIESVVIPNTVTEMGEYAFLRCENLRSITLGNGIKTIPFSAFNNCKSLTEITLPSGVETIDGYAFYNCTTLTKIVLSANLKSVGELAFSYCERLVEVYNPSAYKIDSNTIEKNYLGYAALKIHTSLAEKSALFTVGDQYIAYDDGKNIYLIYYYGSDTEVVLPETVNGKNYILYFTFYQNSTLKAVTLPQGLVAVGNGAFCECVSLKSISLPNGIKYIGDVAFDKCESLEAVKIPGSVEYIGTSAFRSCKNLASVEIEKGVKTIGKSAFEYLVALKKLELPNSVETINDYAFWMGGLEEIIIPASVTTITGPIFSDAPGLTIYLEVKVKPSGWNYMFGWELDRINTVWGYTGK